MFRTFVCPSRNDLRSILPQKNKNGDRTQSPQTKTQLIPDFKGLITARSDQNKNRYTTETSRSEI